MTTPYVAPTVNANAFNCPCCGAFSNQIWRNAYSLAVDNSYDVMTRRLDFAECVHCQDVSLWLDGSLLIPQVSTAPQPHSGLPAELSKDYEEARAVLNSSPRSAAALLRLVVQKLCVVLGESGKNINADIASLVEKGLPEKVQKALDIVRVVGNEQVHPGELDVRDDPDIAIELFHLVNFIVEDQIARPKAIENMYQRLPEAKRKGIEERDSAASKAKV